MVNFEKFILDNGLKVVVHEDPNTPMAAFNILYNVGARDELEEKTGFAHLFEHLMFEGSKNIPNFDEPLQRAGGESNAFTNNDITNYYNLLPAYNLETAFWLESDRMLHLDINEHSLAIQRKVVCEEFKENYLNQPYGDIWHKICDLSYKVHPYKWPTIGKDLSHVEDATLEDVQFFFNKFYKPNNAILVVAGGVKTEEIKVMAEKWFGQISPGDPISKDFPKEPQQTESRTESVEATVPVDAIYKCYHMGARDTENYYVMDIVTDLLSTGTSSRLTQRLMKEQRLFGEIDAYVTGTADEGLIIVEGKLLKDVTMEQADQAITEELNKLSTDIVEKRELEKVKNKQATYQTFSEVNLLNRGIHLAYYELLGDAGRINTELDRLMAITPDQIKEDSNKVFAPENCSTLYYHSKN